MGKQKATVANTDELVRQALITIATADGPVRLVGKGVAPSIFSGKSGANNEAIARLLDESNPLVVASGSAKTQTVALTPAGFALVVDSISPERMGSLVEALLKPLPAGDRITFLQQVVERSPLATAGLLPMLEAARADEKAEAEARATVAAQRRAAEEASLAALERWKSSLQQRRQERIASLQRELAAEGAGPEVPLPIHRPEPAKHEPAPLPRPTDNAAVDFQRNVARRLVSSWVDAWEAKNPAALGFLESALWNVTGFKLVGEVDARVTFDGRYHVGTAGLFTGDVVRIVRPGWILEEDDDREYVVLKAQVAK